MSLTLPCFLSHIITPMHLICSPPTSQTDPSKTYIWSCDFPPPSPSLVSITWNKIPSPCHVPQGLVWPTSPVKHPDLPFSPLLPLQAHWHPCCSGSTPAHGHLWAFVSAHRSRGNPSTGLFHVVPTDHWTQLFFSAFRLCSNVMSCWEWRAQSIYNWTAIMISY